MSKRKDFEFNVGGQKINPVLAVILLVLFLVALFMLTKFIIKILYFLAIPAFIATLILDYKVVLGFVQWLIKLTKRNLIAGLLAILLSALAYPLTSAFLLVKAIFNRKVRQVEKQQRDFKEGELVDFEELDSQPLDLNKRKPAEKQRNTPQDDEYDQFFD